jgi:hypothetical protein
MFGNSKASCSAIIPPRENNVEAILGQGAQHSGNDSEADTFNAPCRHRRRQIGLA